jgi:hypothetical protein
MSRSRAIVFCDPFRLALGQMGNLLLNLTDVVILVKLELRKTAGMGGNEEEK